MEIDFFSVGLEAYLFIASSSSWSVWDPPSFFLDAKKLFTPNEAAGENELERLGNEEAEKDWEKIQKMNSFLFFARESKTILHLAWYVPF